jgi:CubicO group peptidase (beta-lactamase class C family)
MARIASVVFAIAVLVFAGRTAGATGPDGVLAEVDRVVEAERTAQHIPGVSVAVCRHGKIVKAAGYGMANLELEVKANAESIYETGSVGKQFTAMAVMMMVEEGKLGLDDKIGKYIPQSPEAWKDVTVRRLLTHTSGIPDYGAQVDTKEKASIDFRRDYTEDDLVKAFITMPMDFAPGEKWKYSNTGYVLLGVILRRVTGEFYGDFLQQRIFKPLGMKATRIISEEDIVAHRSAGYRLVNGELKNQEWVAPMLNTTADGSLYTNVLDLAKWDAALDRREFLKPASYAAMWSAVKLNDGTSQPYGFGWRIQNENGRHMVMHDGEWQGFTMSIARNLDTGLTVIVMTNLDGKNSKPAKIAEAVAKVYEK